MRDGIASIRETLYGSEPTPSMMESGMTSIRESLYDSPEVYSEFADLIYDLRLYSEETQVIMNEAISKTDKAAEERILRHINRLKATPRTSIYLLSIITAIMLGGIFLISIGAGIIVSLLGVTIVLGIFTVEKIITNIWNKIRHSKELPPSQKEEMLMKIVDDVEELENKYRKANDIKGAERMAKLREKLDREVIYNDNF